MQSTPAVFCTPATLIESTPFMPTQDAFEEASYPWAVETPENSPRWGHSVPNMVESQVAIRREHLRALCTPYFEQMITVLEQASKTQVHPGSELAEVTQAMAYAATSSFQMASYSMSDYATLYDPMLNEDSTEAGDSGAFSCLLSGASSDVGSLDAVDAKSPIPAVPDLDQESDSEKGNMVCRHWKSKGWCRMESNCKFLHPEHKRGISVPKVGNRSSGNCAISGAKCPGMSISEVVMAESELHSASLARRKRRGGRNRTNRNQQVQLGLPEQDVAGVQTAHNFEQCPEFCLPYTSIV